jgi:hypothetical protein
MNNVAVRCMVGRYAAQDIDAGSTVVREVFTLKTNQVPDLAKWILRK